MAKSRRGVGDAVCSVCGVRIHSGEHVMFDSGELIHIACSKRGGVVADLEDRVLTLLRDLSPEGLCHSCLARRLGADYDDMRKATTTLRTLRGVNVGSRRCAVCGQLRVTISTRD